MPESAVLFVGILWGRRPGTRTCGISVGLRSSGKRQFRSNWSHAMTACSCHWAPPSAVPDCPVAAGPQPVRTEDSCARVLSHPLTAPNADYEHSLAGSVALGAARRLFVRAPSPVSCDPRVVSLACASRGIIPFTFTRRYSARDWRRPTAVRTGPLGYGPWSASAIARSGQWPASSAAR